MQGMKFVASPGKTTLKNIEVWTLNNDTQFISIWPGDIIRAVLYDGTSYEGEAVWSIEPWYITVKYMPNESIRFDVNSIVSIEILKYSDLRPNNDRGDSSQIKKKSQELTE